MHSNTTLYPNLATDETFAPDSKIWIYPASRALLPAEAEAAKHHLDAFCQQWTAHNQSLLAKAEIFQNRLVLLMVDETRAGASGCSIDKSVHFLENLGHELGVDFFDRMQFGRVAEGQIVFENRAELEAAVRDGKISPETPMLHTLVQSRRELMEKWLVPFGKSWHRRLV